MSGENDLQTLLQNMVPILHDAEYGYGILPREASVPSSLHWFALIREDEGISVVATIKELETHAIEHTQGWARISLEIHSDLAAVGLTAAIANALTSAKISANVVAGFYHDHVFVQWARRHDAIVALRAISQQSKAI